MNGNIICIATLTALFLGIGFDSVCLYFRVVFTASLVSNCVFPCFALLFSHLRCVVLVALRDIKQGEELFSNYYTIVN